MQTSLDFNLAINTTRASRMKWSSASALPEKEQEDDMHEGNGMISVGPNAVLAFKCTV